MTTPTRYDEIKAANIDAVPVSSIVSPAMHPAAVAEFGKLMVGTPRGAAAFESATKGQAAIYKAAQLIETAVETTMAQHAVKAVVDGQHIRGEIDDAHKATLIADLGQCFDKTARTFDSHLAVVRETLDDLTATIAKNLLPPGDTPSSATAAVQLRQIVSTQADPMGYLMGALKEGDVEIVHAVLATSPRASGLTKLQFDTLKELAAESLCPAEVKQLAATKQTLDAMIRSSQIFVTQYQKRLPIINPSKETAARAALKAGV